MTPNLNKEVGDQNDPQPSLQKGGALKWQFSYESINKIYIARP